MYEQKIKEGNWRLIQLAREMRWTEFDEEYLRLIEIGKEAGRYEEKNKLIKLETTWIMTALQLDSMPAESIEQLKLVYEKNSLRSIAEMIHETRAYKADYIGNAQNDLHKRISVLIYPQ